jgi:hypothetical protein
MNGGRGEGDYPLHKPNQNLVSAAGQSLRRRLGLFKPDAALSRIAYFA